MAESIIFYSEEPLDVEAFSQCCRNLGGTVKIDDGVLHCGSGRDTWYELFFDDPGLEDFSPEQIAGIVTTTGISRPFATAMVHRRKAPDPLLLLLPAWGNVWVSEEADFLFSLKEVQQRIRLGVEYMGRAEREAGIDLVVHREGQSVGGAMVMLDNARDSSAKQREAVFREKLKRYAAHFGRTEALWKSTGFRSENPLIEVLYVVPPTPAMRAITSVSEPAHPEIVLPVEFVTEDEFRERHGFVPRDLPSLRKV